MAHHNQIEGPVNPPIRPKPPIVVLAFILVGIALERLIPLGVTPTPRENIIVGSFVIACAFAIAALAVREMIRVRTTLMPGKPADGLVRSGIFSRSRNPIYLSFVLFIIGLGIGATNPWLILLAPLLSLYLYVCVIIREENYLQQRFGNEYTAYKRQVRRWL